GIVRDAVQESAASGRDRSGAAQAGIHPASFRRGENLASRAAREQSRRSAALQPAPGGRSRLCARFFAAPADGGRAAQAPGSDRPPVLRVARPGAALRAAARRAAGAEAWRAAAVHAALVADGSRRARVDLKRRRAHLAKGRVGCLVASEGLEPPTKGL